MDLILANRDASFQEKLLELMDARGLSGPEVYNPVHISRQTFSSILNNPYYHPNKYMVILFCLSLKLDIDETEDLLARAGWALSPSNRPDLVVKWCIKNGIYNQVQIDIILYDKCNTVLKNIK